MNVEDILASCGFESVGLCDASVLRVRPEVRDMCAADKCRSYDRNWACPPGCGSLEKYQGLFGNRRLCYVAQTVMELEDDFDVEGMMEAAELQRNRFLRLSDALRSALDADGFVAFGELEAESFHVLASGACTICPQCSYPDEPCRFPRKRMVSMEAAGLLVSDVCAAAGIPYNHGRGTIAYTGCLLV